MRNAHWIFVGLTAIRLVPFAFTAEPVEIGSRRELFVDYCLIDQLNGTRLKLHHPRRAGVALKMDRPWEPMTGAYITVFYDEGKYRMYYRGRPPHVQTPKSGAVGCYAESDDGISWTRPSLGFHKVFGTKNNNVILADVGHNAINFAPFVDRRSGVPSSERYKAIGGLPPAGLFAYVSADGLRWKKLRDKAIITEGTFDSQNNAFWSQSEQCYVCCFRTMKNGVRWISRTTSQDFLHWEPAVEIDFGEAPAEHLYTNQTEPYFRAPHIYLGMAARFMQRRRALTDAQQQQLNLPGLDDYLNLRESLSDCVLLSSRGGRHFERTFMESFLRPGQDLQDWVARSNYLARGIVPTGKAEMSLYVKRHYGQPTAYIERLTLRTDGFASVWAPYRGGHMVTKPLTFSGRQLVINYASSAAGGIRVEIQNEAGQALPGFRLNDCPEIIGDEIERVVSWRDGSDVSRLAGQTIRLRFEMKDADLYSVRFHTD
ncbi:MAG: hypothetical protein MK102_12215 [Fuerstiella sp.]|nr:hypothetical protein [Fuerstiella sp.]